MRRPIEKDILPLFPQEEEGTLSKRFVSLVRREHLATIARIWDVASVLKATPVDTPLPDSIYADSVEAVLGAIYLDGGFDEARRIILAHWEWALAGSHLMPLIDAKSRLQEWCQQKGIPLPEYTLLKSDGPDHNPLFTMSVTIQDASSSQMGVGEGSSHRHAEQQAASALLTILKDKDA